MEIEDKVVAIGLNEEYIKNYLNKAFSDYWIRITKEIVGDFRALKFPLDGVISEIYDDYFVVNLGDGVEASSQWFIFKKSK